MKQTPRLALLSIVFVCAAAAGQVTSQYSDWVSGPTRHLMTKDELKQWKAIRSDQEAAAFIDLFWARRDPTPTTPRNEFREEFDRRVELADRTFSSPKARGAMSDPGKVLILLGPPWQVAGKGSVKPVSSLGGSMIAPTDSSGDLIVPGPRTQGPQQIWTYAHEHKPQFIPQDRLVLVFVDEGQNEWQLASTERSNPDAILQRAVNALIVSPALTKAPVFGPPPRAKDFRSADLKTAFSRFRSGEKTSTGPAQLTWGEFLSAENELYVSAQLYASAGSGIEPGQKVTLFSVVENAQGEIVEVDEQLTAMVASGGDSYVDSALRLDPGSYTATFGVAGVDGSIVAATRVPVTVTRLDPAAAGISPLILSNNIYALQVDPGPDDAFTFGGLKVVPKGDLLFVPKGDLWYFAELRKPGLTEQGSPAIKVQVDIAGTTPKGRVALNLPLAPAELAKLKGTTDRYAVGLAIPLEGFVPGDYTIKVRVVDTVTPRTYELEKAFRVRGL